MADHHDERNRVRIFDTTLRDGEQSPGCTMTRSEKLRIARKLEELGVDVIEAGFPAASPGEIESVREIAQAVSRCEVAGLCRTREADIRAAWEAVGKAKHPRLHVFIATSDLHLEYKLKMTREEVLKEIAFGVSLCRSLCDSVEFSAEDATRSPRGFLHEAMACALEHGATVLNVPDTVGYTMPDEYFAIIADIVKLAGDRAIVSAHCHDDLGLAVANSLAAIAAGARQVEGCINGIGERAGNAALEEVVMALRTRPDLTEAWTRIETRKLLAVSRLVSEVTGMHVQANKAIVGKNAFAHEAGIHQHGVLAERRTYEIMKPEDVGFSESQLVLGKHSGRHALRDRLSTMGYVLDDPTVDRIFQDFKKLADKKKAVFEEDLHALVATTLLDTVRSYELERIEFQSGSHTTPRARATVQVDGHPVTGESEGDGPVNAAIEAIKRCTGMGDVMLVDYRLEAITSGSDAQGRVVLRIRKDGMMARGQAFHTDVVVASALAYVDALNHWTHAVELRRLGAVATGPAVPRASA